MNRPQIREASLITDKFGLKKDSYILFLGRLVPEKGIRYLVEAFKNVKTDKKLVIAGGSSDTDPVFCYNGQFRRGADGTPLTYMLHGHIHKTEDQVLVDKFCAETRAMMRKSAHQETAQPVPCQMINCFCMYSDYTPLTLEEWIECDQRRRDKADCG